MKIRTAKLKDIELLIPIFKDYEKSSLSYLPKKYKIMRNKKKPLEKHIKLSFKRDILKKNSKFLVMEDEGKLIGYIFGEIRDDSHPLFKVPKSGELNDLAVLKEYQGKKIASQLWKKLLEWFVRNNCKIITLSVNYNNQAREIYENWGFEKFYLRMIKKL